MTPNEAATVGVEALSTAWRDYTRSQFAPPADAEPRDHVWASSFRDCTRRMALDLQHPEIGRDFVDSSMEAMLRGRERERSIDARLRQLAARSVPHFEVIEGQSYFKIRGRDEGGVKGRVIVTGKIDGRLAWTDGDLVGYRPVFEVKSGRSVENCDTLSDLDRGRWTRHYADQLLMYLLAKAEPWGLLILDRSQGPAFIPLVLGEHLDRAERRLQQAETAVGCRLDGLPLPSYHTDPGECRRCPHFGKTCSPPMAGGEGIQIIEDEDLEAAAGVVAAKRADHLEYDRAKKRLAAALRGVETALLGPYMVTGKWGGMTRAALPPDLAAKHKAEADPYLEFDSHGKWTLTEVVSLESGVTSTGDGEG